MKIENPSASELRLIQAAQQRAWAEVNAKTQWTDKDFESALFSHNEYKPEWKEWFYSMATLEKLAYDARTPEKQARVLQDMLIQYNQQTKTGKL
jgi:hypothetical protein